MGDDDEREVPHNDPTVEITTPSHYATPEGPDIEQVVDDVKDVLNAMNNEEKPKVRRRKRRPKRSPMPGVDPVTGLASVGGPPPPPSKPVLEQPVEHSAEYQLGLDEVPNNARGRSTKSSYLKSVGKWSPWRGKSQSGKEVRRYSSRKRKSKNIRSTSAAPKTKGMEALMLKAGVKTKGGKRGNRSGDIEVKLGGPPAPPPKIAKGDEGLSPLLVTDTPGGLILPPNLLNDGAKRIFRHKVMCVIVWLVTVLGLAGGTGYMTYEASSTSSFARLDLEDSPTARPTRFPVFVPTFSPTHPAPTHLPTKSPTLFPTTPAPTLFPVVVPTPFPTFIPTPFPVVSPTQFPTTETPFPTRDDDEEDDD